MTRRSLTFSSAGTSGFSIALRKQAKIEDQCLCALMCGTLYHTSGDSTRQRNIATTASVGYLTSGKKTLKTKFEHRCFSKSRKLTIQTPWIHPLTISQSPCAHANIASSLMPRTSAVTARHCLGSKLNATQLE